MSTHRVILEDGEITTALIQQAWLKLGHEGFPPTGMQYSTLVVVETVNGKSELKQARVELEIPE
jgi:hypothetical protein